MSIALDIPYLEALFAEMDLRHRGITKSRLGPHAYNAHVDNLPLEQVEQRLRRIGFMSVHCQRDKGAVFVLFDAFPKGAA